MVIVKVSVETPFAKIGFGAKRLLICGGATTVNVAVAEPLRPLFVPVWVVEIKSLTFVLGPIVELVTFTDTVQLLFGGMVPPDKLIAPEPDVAVVVPPHVDASPFGVATVTPVGSVSLKAAPVNGVAKLELVNVNVRVEFLPAAIVGGVKALVSVGCAGTAQPVKAMLSMANSAFACWALLVPCALMRNTVDSPLDAATAVNPVFQVFFVIKLVPVSWVVKAPPSVEV